MRRILFRLTHLVPRVHWTIYSDTATGQRHMAVWRQWGTRCWDVTDLAIV